MLRMAAFWDISQCSLPKADRHFRVAYCLIRAIMEAVHTSESQSTSIRLHNAMPQEVLIFILAAENLKSHKTYVVVVHVDGVRLCL
jgi:hypothetical protein